MPRTCRRLRRRRAFVLVPLVAVVTTATPIRAQIPADWVGKWSEDLRFAQRSAIERHPNLTHSLSREEWEEEFDRLISRVATMEHHEIAVELARIVARIHDGHTRLTLPLGPGIDFPQGHSATPDPRVPELLFHQYAIRFHVDSNGVHVRAIETSHDRALGGRVLELGALGIDEARAAVEETIRRDNDMQLLHHLPMHLVLAEILDARGVTPTRGQLRVVVESPDGGRVEFELQAVAHGRGIRWADARDGAQAPTPLYLQHPERKFWFSHLEKRRTVYLQFNEVYDEEDESLREFAARLERFIADHDVEFLIVDLRANRGGNQRLARPLLHAILRSHVNKTGHLYALIGRSTFSAAMTFALSLEKHTQVVFVGEPTGSTPNHFGDSRKIQLPNTGLTLRVSTLYWQYHPTDGRPWIAPHVPAEVRIQDYVENRDPAVETVLAIVAARQTGVGEAFGSWRGFTSPGLNSFELALDFGKKRDTRVAVVIPQLEIEAAATDLRVRERLVTFSIPWGDEKIGFSGTVAGDWLIGDGDYRTVLFPFVVRREAR